MANLADMIERIVRETIRDDLRSDISSEILSAVRYYQGRRFWFNEKRSRVVFDTVSGRSDYDVADHADIPHLIRIDFVTATKDGQSPPVRLISPEEMERLLGSPSAAAGAPNRFSYYAQELRLYPIPDGVYSIKVAGVTRAAPPASEIEANNPWMNDAEELIRCRAQSKIYANWMGDKETGAAFAAQETEALNTLVEETSRRTQVSRLKASS